MSTETEIAGLLAKKYSPPEYAFLTQVRNGTGCARAVDRTADALAFSLWPSRGLSVSGFEIKISKSDLKSEIANPEKAEAIAQYCDYWWIAVPDSGVLGDLQVPSAWGVMLCNDGQVIIAREATKTASKPLDRLMVCAIMRRAQEEMPQELEIRKREKLAYERGRVCGEAIKRSNVKGQQEEYAQLVGNIKKFHAATGIDIQQNYNLEAEIEEWSKLKQMMELSYDFPGGMPGLLGSMEKDLEKCVNRGEALRARLGELKEKLQW